MCGLLLSSPPYMSLCCAAAPHSPRTTPWFLLPFSLDMAWQLSSFPETTHSPCILPSCRPLSHCSLLKRHGFPPCLVRIHTPKLPASVRHPLLPPFCMYHALTQALRGIGDSGPSSPGTACSSLCPASSVPLYFPTPYIPLIFVVASVCRIVGHVGAQQGKRPSCLELPRLLCHVPPVWP